MGVDEPVIAPRRGGKEPVVLRSCQEVHVHRSTRPLVRDGFPPSSVCLAATAEQQQKQAASGITVAPRRRIGFVPTLGGLHEGHISLVRHARRMCDEVWVSIFLNPTQFQDDADFSLYPMDLQQDLELLRRQGDVDVVFAPTIQELYPHQRGDKVAIGADIRGQFCDLQVSFTGVDDVPGEGAERPGFFRGVGTVVLKLFSLVRPSHAFFGQKDFLQTVCMRALTCCSCADTAIIICPTAREPQGLPLASRNARLDDEGRRLAQRSSAVLKTVECMYNSGERNIQELTMAATKAAKDAGIELPYINFSRQGDGLPLKTSIPENETVCVAVGLLIKHQQSRLVDNFVLSDTQKYGDLLPSAPNTAEGCPSASVSRLPLHAAPCVLLLRSLSLRLLFTPAAAAAPELLQQLRALEKTDPAAGADARQQKVLGVHQQQQFDYYLLQSVALAGSSQLIGYIATSTAASGKLYVERVFVLPSRRRSGIASAFVQACVLLMQQQQQVREVRCLAPRLALKVLESFGFVEVASQQPSPTHAEVCLLLHRAEQLFLSP